MAMYGHHPIAEYTVGVLIAALTVSSILVGFLFGVEDLRRYLEMRRH